MGDDGTPIHGAMSPLGVPVLLERGGHNVKVLEAHPRNDLKIAHWWQKRYRNYWECELRTGETVVVYRDLVKGGWFLEE